MKREPQKNIIKQAIVLALFAGATANVYAASDLTDGNVNNISVSSENSPYEARMHAFDNSEYSKWLTFTSTGWIQYDFQSVVTINQYTVTSGNDASGRDPKTWQLQGSNDGTNWTTIDSRNNESFNNRRETKSYNVNSNQAFIHILYNF